MTARRLTKHWDQLEESEIRELQLRKLRRFLEKQVAPFSAYYAEQFHQAGISPGQLRDFDQFEKLPFTSKKDLLPTEEHPERTREFVLIPDRKALARRPGTVFRALTRGKASARAALEREYRPVFLTATTGRSSDPVTFLYSAHDLDNLTLAGQRLVQVFDTEPEYRVMNLFPFAPHLAFWQVHYGSVESRLFTLSTGGGKVMGTDKNIQLIAKVTPQALIGMPTFLYHVLQQMLEEKRRCDSLKRLILGGEKAPAGMRRKLRSMAEELGSGDIHVLATYGFTEAKMAFGECPFPRESEPSGYHLYPDLALIEVIDPETGRVLPPGHPGEIVFTPLDARGSVVVRYRTGDLIDGGLRYETCPCCGRSAPRLVGRISRKSEVREMNFDKLKGTLIDFNELENVLEEVEGVGSWQIELRKANDDPMDLDEIIIHIGTGSRDHDKIRKRIGRVFEERFELRPNGVDFHSLSEMRELHGVGTALKEEKVVDRRLRAEEARNTANLAEEAET